MPGGVVGQFPEIKEDMGLVGMQFDEQPLSAQFAAGADVVEPGDRVAKHDEPARFVAQAQTLAEVLLLQGARPAGAVLAGESGRDPHPARRVGEAVVDHDQAAFAFMAVGEGDHVLVHRPAAQEKIVEPEIAHPGEQRPGAQQREYLPLVALEQFFIDALVQVGPAVFHPVFFPEALDLAVAEHGQPRQGGHQGAGAEILVAAAELGDARSPRPGCS